MDNKFYSGNGNCKPIRVIMGKTILFIFLLLLADSCVVKKETEPVCEPVNGVIEKRMLGEIIHDACGWYIRSIGNDPILHLKPCNLPNSYRTEGLKIKFTYQLIVGDPHYSTNCSHLIPVKLEDWWAVREGEK